MLCRIIPTLWWGYKGLFVIKFSFVQDHVSKVFDDILVYVSNEGFDVVFGNVKIG